jgi:hypothetical protein
MYGFAGSYIMSIGCGWNLKGFVIVLLSFLILSINLGIVGSFYLGLMFSVICSLWNISNGSSVGKSEVGFTLHCLVYTSPSLCARQLKISDMRRLLISSVNYPSYTAALL